MSLGAELTLPVHRFVDVRFMPLLPATASRDWLRHTGDQRPIDAVLTRAPTLKVSLTAGRA